MLRKQGGDICENRNNTGNGRNAGRCYRVESTTLFALAQGEEILEHTSTRTALAIVLEGRIIFTVDGEEKEIQAMEAVHLPASVVHALRADTNSRMLLIQKGEQ